MSKNKMRKIVKICLLVTFPIWIVPAIVVALVATFIVDALDLVDDALDDLGWKKEEDDGNSE